MVNRLSLQIEKMMNRFFWIPLLGALLLASLLTGVALAQDIEPDLPTDDEVNAIAKDIYCPVCENTPLDVCPTQVCSQWRELIREQLAQGKTESEIKTYFVEYYGDRVLAMPPPRGLNWLVYVVPPLAFLAGGLILYRAMLAWKRPAPGESLQHFVENPPQDEYVARLEEELRKR
jgi:cytochrome c-type biogenesis protein CcmH